MKKTFGKINIIILISVIFISSIGCSSTLQTLQYLNSYYNSGSSNVQNRDSGGTKLSKYPSTKGERYQCWACDGKGYRIVARRKHTCSYCNGRGWRIY